MKSWQIKLYRQYISDEAVNTMLKVNGMSSYYGESMVIDDLSFEVQIIYLFSFVLCTSGVISNRSSLSPKS